MLYHKRQEDLQQPEQKNVSVHPATGDSHVKNVLLDITDILMTDLKDLLENVPNALVMIMNNCVARNVMEEFNVSVRRDGLVHIATLEVGK